MNVEHASYIRFQMFPVLFPAVPGPDAADSHVVETRTFPYSVDVDPQCELPDKSILNNMRDSR